MGIEKLRRPLLDETQIRRVGYSGGGTFILGPEHFDGRTFLQISGSTNVQLSGSVALKGLDQLGILRVTNIGASGSVAFSAGANTSIRALNDNFQITDQWGVANVLPTVTIEDAYEFQIWGDLTGIA